MALLRHADHVVAARDKRTDADVFSQLTVSTEASACCFSNIPPRQDQACRLRDDPNALRNPAKIRQLRSDEKTVYANVRECFKVSSSDYDKASKKYPESARRLPILPGRGDPASRTTRSTNSSGMRCGISLPRSW
jgi:hypothetical protein